MTNHHAVHVRAAQRAVLTRKMAKDRQLLSVQLLARAVDFRQIVMRVHRRRGVTGKMFAAAQDPLLAKRVVKRAGQPNDLFDVLAITTPAQRIVRVLIEGNIEHGTQIELEPESEKELSGDFAMPPNECNLVLIAQLLGIRRLVPAQPLP